MSKDQDPLEPVKRLGKHLQRVAEEAGLELHTFAVLPNFEDGPSVIQAMFVFDETATAKAAAAASVPEHEKVDSPDQADFDKQFEEMMRGQKKNEEQDKMDDAAAAALRMAQDLMKGTMGGDTPPEEPEAEAS